MVGGRALKQEADGRRKKLTWVILTLTLIIVVALAALYVNFSNVLNNALQRSLSRFSMDSVAYPMVNLDAVDINITFILENPSDLTITVEVILLSFWVDDEDIGTVSVMPHQEAPPGEASYFYFVRHVTDITVLESFQNPNYELRIEGRISGSARYFFIEATLEKSVDSIQTVSGIG